MTRLPIGLNKDHAGNAVLLKSGHQYIWPWERLQAFYFLRFLDRLT